MCTLYKIYTNACIYIYMYVTVYIVYIYMYIYTTVYTFYIFIDYLFIYFCPYF